MKTDRKAASPLLFSSIFSGGVYEATGARMRDPLRPDCEAESPVVRSVLTGDKYYLKMSTCDEAGSARYREKILLPPDRTHILWPEDLVRLDGKEDSALCSGLVMEQDYSATPKPDAERRGSYALLFAVPDGQEDGTGKRRNSANGQQNTAEKRNDGTARQEDTAEMQKQAAGKRRFVDSRTWIREAGERSWKNPKMRQTAREILLAIESINRSGYAYQEIHLSRLFFAENGQAYFDFSNLIYHFSEIASPQATEICAPAQGEYPMDFAEPAFLQGLIPHMDLHTQNYSVTALLFYLLFGRYPYQGGPLRHYNLDETEPLIHFAQFRDYHKMPVFVFDPKDTRNALGTYTSDQREIDAWNECPEPVREYFLRTLRQENAERDSVENVESETTADRRRRRTDNPTPAMWLEAFARAGWV